MVRFRCEFIVLGIGLWSAVAAFAAEAPSYQSALTKHMAGLGARAAQEGPVPTPGPKASISNRTDYIRHVVADDVNYAAAISSLKSLLVEIGEPKNFLVENDKRHVENQIEFLEELGRKEEFHEGDLQRLFGWSRYGTRMSPVVTLWNLEKAPSIGKRRVLADMLYGHSDHGGGDLALLSLLEVGGDDANSQQAYLRAGSRFLERDKHYYAELMIRRVYATPISAGAKARASLLLAHVERESGRPEGALKYYQEVLETKPKRDVDDGWLMWGFGSTRHSAAEEASRVHEDLGHYHQALRYALLARFTYPPASWCGTCRDSMVVAGTRRLAMLFLRGYGVWLGIAGVAFGTYRIRRRRLRLAAVPVAPEGKPSA